MIYPTQQQLELFKKTPGAISVHEMLGIMSVVSKAPDGVFLECGAHRGKSGSATAAAMSRHHGTKLHLCDPLFDMTNLEAWTHACQGHPDNAWQGAREPGFNGSVANVISEASDGMVEAVLHGDFSTHAIPAIHAECGDFAYVFLDTNLHEYPLLREECDLLLDKVMIGGIIGYHDFTNQHLGVEQVYREMLQGSNWMEISIPWDEIKQWVSANGGEAGNDSWHNCENPAPCFYGAIVKVK